MLIREYWDGLYQPAVEGTAYRPELPLINQIVAERTRYLAVQQATKRTRQASGCPSLDTPKFALVFTTDEQSMVIEALARIRTNVPAPIKRQAPGKSPVEVISNHPANQVRQLFDSLLRGDDLVSELFPPRDEEGLPLESFLLGVAPLHRS